MAKKSAGLKFRLKNRWNKKLSVRGDVKMCGLTAGIKKYKSIVKEKKKKHDKIVFLGKLSLKLLKL